MSLDSDGDAMMVDDDGNDAARSGGRVRRSNHDRSMGLQERKEAVFGKTGAHGDSILKICQNRKPLIKAV